MSAVTHIIVQPYARGPKGGLKPEPAILAKTAEAAIVRAERMFAANGKIVGVDVVRTEVDEEAGDYSEPVYLQRLGMVPELAN